MKQAYHEEIDKLKLNLETVKMELESFYSQRHEDKDIVGPVRESYDEFVVKADSALNQFGGAMKSIRSALASSFACISTLVWYEHEQSN